MTRLRRLLAERPRCAGVWFRVRPAVDHSNAEPGDGPQAVPRAGVAAT